jgi:thiamine biosynthesis protein ThiI
MFYKTYLIKYGEIGVKGKNRASFEDALVSQVRAALSRIGEHFHVWKEQGRIIVDVLGDERRQTLTK